MLLITDVLIDCIVMQIISAYSLAYTERGAEFFHYAP